MFKQKFKVWDEKKQRWSNERFGLLQDGNLIKLDNLEVVFEPEYVPCFFTAFYASGEEVYTGDILQYEYETYPTEIKHPRSVLIYGLEKAEIIGNVFETPELLAGAKKEE